MYAPPGDPGSSGARTLPDVLVLLPPSRSHCPVPARGRRLDLATLSFPSLTPTRTRVLGALAEASLADDAAERFGVGTKLLDDVRRNARLAQLPTVEAGRLYTGVLYDALDLPSLDVAALRRARRRIVITSGLWGALRPADRVPAYRLGMDVALPGLATLASVWRPALTDPLTEAAGPRGLVVDCRSADYVAAWPLTGPLAARSIAVRALHEGPNGRTVISHMAKHVRGLVTRALMLADVEPRSPKALAAQLTAAGWTVELAPPARVGTPWRLDVVTT